MKHSNGFTFLILGSDELDKKTHSGVRIYDSKMPSYVRSLWKNTINTTGFITRIVDLLSYLAEILAILC